LPLAVLAGLLAALALGSCVPAQVSSLRAPVNLSEPDPIRAQNSGLLAEQHLPESEQAPVAAAVRPAPPGALSPRPEPYRLKGLAEAPPKATDIPEFPSLDDLEVEARLERLSKLPPSLGLDVVRTGLTQKGRRYRWGGAIPSTGFDCSGFTQWTFQQHDIRLPRTAREQFGVGERISRHELRAGDLVFYKINRRGRWHVGIYMDDGVFVHSPRRGRSISEANMDDAYWAKRYMGARRYVR
jgi:cell wall-associated NlpC family hydrolase